MMRLILTAAVLLAAIGEACAQRFLIRRAERVIARTPIPDDHNAGVAFVRIVKIGHVPGPLGLFSTTGRGVVFEENEPPKIVRVNGKAVLLNFGIGATPWSIQLNRQVIAFKTQQELTDFATKTHVQGSLKIGFAAMGPGMFVAKGFGPTFGSRPGKVISNKTFSLGLFANVGIMGEVIVTSPRRKR